jgi:putative endopeptidase
MLHRLLIAVPTVIVTAAGMSACERAPSPDSQASLPSITTAPAARVGPWGFDLSGMDKSVKPGDDFYEYANGQWLETQQIPPDLSRWGVFTKLVQQSEEQVHTLLEEQGAVASGSVPQKVHDFYRSYLDTDAIERAGLEPARAGLTAIGTARSHADIATLLGRPDLGLDSPISLSVVVDEKNPDRYIVGVTQSGLGLPDRDYYLKDDPALVEIRNKYLVHIQRMLELGGERDSGRQAKAILDLETEIARRHWPIAKRRERELTYNLRTRGELDTLGRKFPWRALLTAAGLDRQPEFVVAELDAVQSLASFFPSVPVSTWKSYLTYHYLTTHAGVLPKAFDDERFDFYGRTLNGQLQQRERWKRALTALDAALGEAVGQMYVQRYFPPESKQKVLALVENLRRAYAERMRSLPWMSEETKKIAEQKLATFRPKIGYTDKWRDYSALEIRGGDAFGNAVRSRIFNWEYDLNRLGKPTDRGEWFITPQTVNAYYNPVFNEIVFPAAILQPPFFDPAADDAVNYGAIGGVIGHEMGHGFDDQGAKSDAQGVLRTWWGPVDEAAFKKLVDRLVAQYDTYEALPGLHVNGRLTVGENIGDLGGLTVAHEAYRLALSGQEPPVRSGFTGDQRFFLSWAQVWRELNRDASLRNQVMSNPHSPGVFRVNGVVRNMDAWYAAFGVKPGQALYLAPDDRVRIW